jgi:hypothetical protein
LEVRLNFSWIVLLVWVLSPSPATAQGNVSDLESRWQKKQAAPFLKAVPWERTLEAAKARSSRDSLPIVAYFTRSYSP